MVRIIKLLAIGLLTSLTSFTKAIPLESGRKPFPHPQMTEDFPDPSILQASFNEQWYAFASAGNGKQIQLAEAKYPLEKWKLSKLNPLSNKGWTSGQNTWSPEVKELPDGSYIMYFSGELPKDGKHCIGIARSAVPWGPYVMDPKPWICPDGGAMDPSRFTDPVSKKVYITYRTSLYRQGSSMLSTPIMLQQVDPTDGSTKTGNAIELIDRGAGEGPFLESPSLVYLKNAKEYVLTYSSHCSTVKECYDVKTATSKNIEGPYKKVDEPMLTSENSHLWGPSSLTLNQDGSVAMVNAWCGSWRWKNKRRCAYAMSTITHKDKFDLKFRD